MISRRKGAPPAENKEDCTLLDNISEESIVNNLKERHLKLQPFTHCGSSTVIYVNPSKYVNAFSEEAVHQYAEHAASTAGDKSPLPSHVFQITASAFHHMLREAQDQSIILSGESGSGKSEVRKLIVKELCALSKNSKKKSRVHSGVIKTETALEAFGNAYTSQNKNSSRFGRYSEYQFNEGGKMVGTRTLDYLLEKARVSNVPADERNFNIFYYLLAGCTPDERVAWRLVDPPHFTYLESRKHKQVTQEDSVKMTELREHLQSLGVGRRQQSQIFQLVAAILHIGNIAFTDDLNNPQESCAIKNWDHLEFVSHLLGVTPHNLELTLTYKTKLVKKELCQVFLDASGAALQRDLLAQSLYSLLFGWIVEHINSRLDIADAPNFICIVDFPGLQDLTVNGFEQLMMNYSNERLQSFFYKSQFEEKTQLYLKEGISANLVYENNQRASDLFDCENGILNIIDQESLKGASKKQLMNRLITDLGSNENFTIGKKNQSFSINHYAGVVEYEARGFIDKNTEALSSDFVSLFRGNDTLDIPTSSNKFYQNLFSDTVLTTETHTLYHGVLVAAQHTQKARRHPSLKRKKSTKKTEGDSKEPEQTEDPQPTFASSLQAALNELFGTLSETVPWFVCCIRPNDDLNSERFDSHAVKAQIRNNNLMNLANSCLVYDHTASYEFEAFLSKFSLILQGLQLTGRSRQKCESLVKQFGWTEKDMIMGRNRVFISEASWRSLEDELRHVEEEEFEEERKRLEEIQNEQNDNNSSKLSRAENSSSSLMHQEGSVYSDNESVYHDDERDSVSHFGSEFGSGLNRDQNSSRDFLMEPYKSSPKDIEMGNLGAGKKSGAVEEVEKPKKLTPARRKWLCLTWFCTWWIFPFCLSLCGRMKRRDVQIAWREKFTLCMIIFLFSASMIFYIIGLGRIICPQQQVLSQAELLTKKDQVTAQNEIWVSAYGKVYEINQIAEGHRNSYGVENWKFSNFDGVDVSGLFYKNTLLDRYCPNMKRQFEPGWDNIVNRPNSDYIYYAHRARDPSSGNTKLYLEYMNQFVKYRVAFTKEFIKKTASQEKKLIVIFDNVYDVSTYFNSPAKPFGLQVESLFSMVGDDVTDRWRQLKLGSNDPTPKDILNCMNNLFYIGTVDKRNDFRCQFSNYILLASTIILVSVIGFKFLAALQFGSSKEPEDHDKFVICQVPCYTEGADSLTTTLESLALLRYDDKRKLIFIVCDGMIIGSGNDRPTPRIVLDILGVDPELDPEPLSFNSLGEGDKQHNMGKVYSGLYEIQGRSVPFVVVVKVGKPTERSRPGNRGKRDSQMLLMRYLSRVHFNAEMSPLELELYHQMKNVIGVNPSFYEYILMVDADTEVQPNALNRMVSAMIHDSKIMGICGETLLANEKDSWITMIQVYEYFISHHLSKAFESLFGSVTCLPGCFCMYRVRTPTKNIPLLISPGVVSDYSENVVETLHMKNLLHLGEDRYLTTLMMKHFPQLKLCFTPDAQCRTNAPDRWAVLLSQRRRWINSTVHNLLELMMLPELCGFCCFSMRFVVFLDLFATVVQPAGVLYIGYLIYMGVTAGAEVFPLVSIIMIAAIYGLQVIIFILKKQWAQIGWMLVYILSMPVFSFYIPLYSFWHFDDFSWGNTRVVVGEGGKKIVYAQDINPFDPKSIPMKKWAEYELELSDKQRSQGSSNSDYSANNQNTSVYQQSIYTGQPGPGSVYGGGSVYGPPAAPPSVFMGPPVSGSMYGIPTDTVPIIPPTASLYAPQNRQSMYGLGDHRLSAAFSMNDPAIAHMPNLPPSVAAAAAQRHSMAFSMNGPTDEDLARDIRQLLSTVDLMTITKKQVRDELSAKYGVDLSSKRAVINALIEDILQGN